jgi:hypothetical protein
VEKNLAVSRIGIEEFAESDNFCDKRLYPRQKLLLKLIFLEELSNHEEDVLNIWISGGRGGSEIKISPNIRDRVNYLREKGYSHFREIALVGGRRSSKGFCTGMALGKVMWDTLQLQDPNREYGIDPDKDIYFSCVAGSEKQAQQFQFADFIGTVGSCSAFEPYLMKSLETEFRVATPEDLRKQAQLRTRGSKLQRDIAKLRGNALAANAGTLRGSATMAIAQPMFSKVWTPKGWTTIGELQPGSIITGSDGKSQKVLKIHPRGVQPAYRVVLSDGSSTICGADHLWNVNQKDRKVKTKPLIDLFDDLYKKNGEHSHAKWRLPKQPVVEGDYKLPLPLHPYLLGVMLGDGSMTQRVAKFYNTDPSIIEAISQVLPTGHVIKFRSGIGYDLVSEGHKNLIIRALKEVGAWGHLAPVKFIPERCFELSSHDRLSLLQGLLDTDGSVSGTSVRFGSSSLDLAEGVIALVRSIGGYATLHVSHRENSVIIGNRALKPQGEFFEVCISGLDATTLFRSEVKKNKACRYIRYTERHRRIVAIESVEDTEMQCITVSNEDGLYLTDDLIVTHNCIDEMAHMIPGESKASADEVYKAATPSLDQFGKDAIILCNSSPYSKVGMFYERHMEAMKEYNPVYEPGETIKGAKDSDNKTNGSPFLFTLQYPSWALFEGYKHRQSKFQPNFKFRKAITVSPDWDPNELDAMGKLVYSDEDRSAIVTQRAEEASNPESFKVERRGQFAEVTDAYLNPELVNRMFAGVPDGRDDNGRIILLPYNTNWGQGATNLFKYKAHLDPSSTTAGFGFALGHPERYVDHQGNEVEHVVFDIIKRWNPKDFPGETIQWSYVINEVIGYIDLFRPYEVTFDQFQSAEPIQTLQYALQERGIDGCRVYVKTATLEHNWFRAETFKTALNHSLVHAPNDTTDLELASNELKFLQEHRTGGRYPRVDKQSFGPVQTKDMADCIMEVVDGLIGNVLAQTMRERASQAVFAPGAPGGFRIGGDQGGSTLPPGLEGYYGSKRKGEQGFSGYGSSRPRSGGASRGISRGGRRGR